VHLEARVLGQPVLHIGMLVRGVVVGDQVQRLVLGRFAVDLFQELQPLGVGVPLLALANDLAIEHVEGGEQRGGAVALVIVGHRLRPSLLQRQSRLRAVQSLHLALLIAAEHQRVFGRRQVQADDVFEFFDKVRIPRDLEG
jgi:hypothetical protein